MKQCTKIYNMRLTKRALRKIDNTETRLKIALALGCGERTIYNYIMKNSDQLTKAAAMQIIREETGLTDEEILEPVTA